MLQSPGLVENCVGLYVPLLEFNRGLVNLHYGQDPGVKFYTHLSDQFGPFHTKVIAATANEAPYVLDGLLYHQSSLGTTSPRKAACNNLSAKRRSILPFWASGLPAATAAIMTS